MRGSASEKRSKWWTRKLIVDLTQRNGTKTRFFVEKMVKQVDIFLQNMFFGGKLYQFKVKYKISIRNLIAESYRDSEISIFIFTYIYKGCSNEQCTRAIASG